MSSCDSSSSSADWSSFILCGEAGRGGREGGREGERERVKRREEGREGG